MQHLWCSNWQQGRRRIEREFVLPNHNTGPEPFATVDGLRMAKHHMFFPSAKAERDLGFRARPYGEALADTIDWFREAGYLDGTRRHQTAVRVDKKCRQLSA
jgi:hypothetical protein